MNAIPPPDPSLSLQQELVLVTPAIATEWLALNTLNRKPKPRLVARYAEDMLAGRWEQTGDSIKFSRSGALIDGQHRLLGLVKAGVSLYLAVTRGLTDSSFAAIDSHGPRTLGDVLGIKGETSRTILGAALTHLWRHREKEHLATAPTRLTLLALFEGEQGLRDSLCYVVENRWQGLAPTALLTFFHYVFRGQNAVEADVFFEQLRTGEALASGDPVKALRSRLIQDKGKLDRVEIIALFFKAWLAHQHGQQISVLRITRNVHGRVIVPEID